MENQPTKEERMSAREIAMLLRALVSIYRGSNRGKYPRQIFASPDIFASLARQTDASVPLKRTASGYVFEGIAIAPKPLQELPFTMRP